MPEIGGLEITHKPKLTNLAKCVLSRDIVYGSDIMPYIYK